MAGYNSRPSGASAWSLCFDELPLLDPSDLPAPYLAASFDASSTLMTVSEQSASTSDRLSDQIPLVAAGSFYASSTSEASDCDYWATFTADCSSANSAATSPDGEIFGTEACIPMVPACTVPHGSLRAPSQLSASLPCNSATALARSPALAVPSTCAVSFIHVTASDFSGDKDAIESSRRDQDVEAKSPTRKRVRARPTVEDRIAAGRIPRPPNPFILYRSAQYRRLSETSTSKGEKLAQSDLCKEHSSSRVLQIQRLICDPDPNCSPADRTNVAGGVAVGQRAVRSAGC